MPAPALRVQITPALAQTVPAGTSLRFAASAINDLSNSGVTWSVQCDEVDCGSVEGAQNPSLYTAPASVDETIAVTLTATSNADLLVTDTVQITVTPAEMVTITSAQSEVPYGMVGQPYAFETTTIGGPVIVSPFPDAYLFSYVDQTALPDGLLDYNEVVLGSPTTAGTTLLSLKAKAQIGTESEIKNLSITINDPPAGEHNSLLSGQYALLVHGHEDAGSALIGSIHADGLGNITWGTLEEPSQVDWSGATYSIGEDNHGILTIPYSQGLLQFALAVGMVKDGVAQEIDVIVTTFLKQGSGKLVRQEPLSGASCDTFQSGTFVFGMSGLSEELWIVGWDRWERPALAAGIFEVTTGGTITGTADVRGQEIATALPLQTGSCSSGNGLVGRGILHLESPQAPAGFPQDYVFYVVDPGRAFVMNVRGPSVWNLAGEIRRQNLPTFDDSSLDEAFVAYGVSHRFPPTAMGQPEAVPYESSVSPSTYSTFLLRGNCNGSGGCTLAASERQAGRQYLHNSIGDLQVAVESSGRVTIDTMPWILYLYDRNRGFLLDMASEDSVTHGYIDPILSPLPSPAGEYIIGDMPLPSYYRGRRVGVLTLETDGEIRGTRDTSFWWIYETAGWPAGYSWTAAGLSRTSIGEPVRGSWDLPTGEGRFQIKDETGDITLVCYTVSASKAACITPGHPELSVTLMQRSGPQ